MIYKIPNLLSLVERKCANKHSTSVLVGLDNVTLEHLTFPSGLNNYVSRCDCRYDILLESSDPMHAVTASRLKTLSTIGLLTVFFLLYIFIFSIYNSFGDNCQMGYYQMGMLYNVWESRGGSIVMGYGP